MENTILNPKHQENGEIVKADLPIEAIPGDLPPMVNKDPVSP
jgi:hypothetical protein